jgi:hypothetical protein
MRTVHFRSLSIAAIAILTFAGSVSAQEKPSGLLNSLEVQQLVKRAEPGDNARLAAHFTALADRYAAEARRHTSMAQSFVGNPSRNLGSGMSAHCKQLADLNTKSPLSSVDLPVTTRNWPRVLPRRRRLGAHASREARVRQPRPSRNSTRWRPRRARPPITVLSRSTS